MMILIFLFISALLLIVSLKYNIFSFKLFFISLILSVIIQFSPCLWVDKPSEILAWAIISLPILFVIVFAVLLFINLLYFKLIKFVNQKEEYPEGHDETSTGKRKGGL